MEPPTLFTLSWRATLQNARKGRIELDSQRFPNDFAKKVFDQSKHGIFSDAFHPRTIRWFSEHIFRFPQKIYAAIGILSEGKHFCKILLQRPQEYEFWFKWELILSNEYTDTGMVQFGSKILPTKIEEKRNRPSFTNRFFSDKNDHEICITSYVTELKHSKIEMIEWICMAFRCNISVLKIETPFFLFDEYKDWLRIRDAGYLLLDSNCDYEILSLVIKERQRRNLRTQLSCVVLFYPFPASLFSFDMVDVHFSKFNLSEYTIVEFVDFIREILNQKFDRLVLRGLPIMSADQFESFKAEFNLVEKQDNRISKEYRFTDTDIRVRCMFHTLKLYHFRDENKGVVLFEFFRGKEGVCWTMRIFEKGPRMRSYPNIYF